VDGVRDFWVTGTARATFLVDIEQAGIVVWLIRLELNEIGKTVKFVKPGWVIGLYNQVSPDVFTGK
jgi:hypothetical protein